jgi:hypothetical protein
LSSLAYSASVFKSSQAQAQHLDRAGELALRVFSFSLLFLLAEKILAAEAELIFFSNFLFK